MFDVNQLKPGALQMMKVNMGVRPGESILFTTDIPLIKDWEGKFDRIFDFAVRSLMVKKIYEIIKQELPDNRVDFIPYPSVGQNGSEPPVELGKRMAEYDVIMAITTYSMSHTKTRENACVAGARVASVPGLELGMLLPGGPMAADYNSIKTETIAIAELVTQAETAHVVTDYGTDLTFSLKGRAGGADTGLILGKGDWGNLPGGEVFAAPVEGTAQGVLMVPAGWYPGLKQDMKMEFKDGYVVTVEGGGEVGDEFKNTLKIDDSFVKHRRNCAELGIGTNPNAKKPDNVLEAEKIRGTVHIAIGDSSHMGGNNESDLHEDFVLPEPTLILDGKVVIDKGIYKI